MSILSNIFRAIFGTFPPISPTDFEDILNKKAQGTNLEWKTSIVDLMKLLDLDSSLAARETLAKELGYPGLFDGSADMNIWLHNRVMTKIEENGGKVPSSLK